MVYTFKQNFLSSNKYSIKAPNSMVPQYITVHNTANDASAANEIKYMLSNNNQVSYHVAVDDKEVIQAIPFNRNAWHCGDGHGTGNRKSIGVEICYSKSGGVRYATAEENSVQYIAKLLKQYGWGIERVKKHQDWNGKYCPHRILSENSWNSFLKRIEAAMNTDKYKDKIGYNIADDASIFRIQSGKYESKEDAVQAAEKALQAGIISYATVTGTTK